MRQPSACASSSFPSDARGQGRGQLFDRGRHLPWHACSSGRARPRPAAWPRRGGTAPASRNPPTPGPTPSASRPQGRAAGGETVGAAGRGGLAAAGGGAGLVQPRAERAAGQPRRVRLPDRGAGPGRRAGHRLLLLHPVPGRLSAADHAGVLVHQQRGDRVPRGAADQRGGQRAADAPGLRDGPAARAGPPGRLRRGHGHGAAPGRAVLLRVRADRRDLPGPGARLAARGAQLADRPVHARPVRGRGRLRAAGRVLLRGAQPGPGHRVQLRGGGRAGGLAPPGAAPHGRGGRGGAGGVGRRRVAAGPLPGRHDVPRGHP